MEMHVTGPPVPGELRQHVLAALLGHCLFSEAEHAWAVHFVHECEDIARLTRWGASVRVEIARREAEAARRRHNLAMSVTLRRLRSTNFCGHPSRPRRPRPTWVPGAFFPDRADRWAGTFDRLATARFQLADSVPFATLFSRPSR